MGKGGFTPWGQNKNMQQGTQVHLNAPNAWESSECGGALSAHSAVFDCSQGCRLQNELTVFSVVDSQKSLWQPRDEDSWSADSKHAGWEVGAPQVECHNQDSLSTWMLAGSRRGGGNTKEEFEQQDMCELHCKCSSVLLLFEFAAVPN